MQGAERSTRKEQVLKQIKQLTRLIGVKYALNEKICQYYAQHFSQLKSAGTPIGANDLWIACHALAEDVVLVTNNTREFERIQGLTIENWVGA